MKKLPLKTYSFPNPNYYCYIPEYDDIYEYHVMCSSKDSEKKYFNNSDFEFIGYGYMVGTTIENLYPEKYGLFFDDRLCAFFRYKTKYVVVE